MVKKHSVLSMIVLAVFLLAYPATADRILDLYTDALQKESAGNCSAAIFLYQDILEENKYFVEARTGLARCYYKTGSLAQSEEMLLAVLKQEKNNVEALILLGRVHTALTRFEEAEDVLVRAEQLRPTALEPKYALADLYRIRGDYARAVSIYNEVLKVHPQEVMTYIHLGIAYTEMNDLRRAGGFFRKAVSLDSQNPLTHLNLARHYYRTGLESGEDDSAHYFDASLDETRTALQIDPGLSEARRVMASVFFYREEYESALETLLTLLEEDESYVLRYEAGFCCEELGRPMEAIDHYEKALARRIDDEVVRFRLESLLLATYRMDLDNKLRKTYADYHLKRARSHMNRHVLNKAFLHYKRAVMLDPLDAEKRLELAELIRIQRYPERYLYELETIIRDTLDVSTVDIEDKIEIYKNRIRRNPASVWGLDQYGDDEESPSYVPATKTRILVFDGFTSDWGHENFVHRRISKTFSELLSAVLVYHPKIEVLTVSEPMVSKSEALRIARSLDADYYITGSIEEKNDSLRIRTLLLSGRGGKKTEEFLTYYTGNDKLFNAAVALAARIDGAVPLRGIIVRLEGGRSLINLGRAHGVEEGMVFRIFKEGGLNTNPRTGEYEVDPDVELGRMTVTGIDEMIAEGDYTFTGTYNRVNVYDAVLLSRKGEEKNAAGLDQDPETGEAMKK